MAYKGGGGLVAVWLRGWGGGRVVDRLIMVVTGWQFVSVLAWWQRGGY